MSSLLMGLAERQGFSLATDIIRENPYRCRTVNYARVIKIA